MEKRKAVVMLIARYRADAVVLEQREADLLKQIEIIENLIPTVTISYMSRSIRSGQMLLPHQEVEEAKERLAYLKRSLRELQQSIGIVRKEAAIMNERIVELETHLIEKNNYHTTMSRFGNFDIWNESYENEDNRTESSKNQGVNFKEKTQNQSSVLQQKTANNNDKVQQQQNKTKNYINLKTDDPNNQGNLQKKDEIRENKDIETGRLKLKDKDEKFDRLKQSQSIKLNEPSSNSKVRHLNKIIDNTDSKTNHSIKNQHSDKIDYNIKTNDISQQSDKAIVNAVTKPHRKAQISSTSIESVIPNLEDEKHNSDKIGLTPFNKLCDNPENMYKVITQPDVVDRFSDKRNSSFPKLENEETGSDQIASIIPMPGDVNQLSNITILSPDDSDNVGILHEMTVGNNDNEIDLNRAVVEDQRQVFEKMLQVTDSALGNDSNKTNNLCSKSDLPNNGVILSQISNELCNKEREVIKKDSIKYQSVEIDELENNVGTSIKENPDEMEKANPIYKNKDAFSDKVLGSDIPTPDKMQDQLFNMLGKPSSIPKPEEQEFKIPLQTADKEGKFVENHDELLDISLKFEELLKAEDTNWKQIHEKLTIQVNELSENLINASQKIKFYEEYVKHLEKKISMLENELKVRIDMLEQNRAKCVIRSEVKIKQDMTKTLTTKPSMLGEGEGVTPAYMQLAHWRFSLKLPEYQGDRELKEKLMNGIKQGNMAPYYKEVCADLGWKFDSKLYDEMSAANVKRLEELEKEHENNVMDEEDQSQLCGVWQSKLDYLCSIGDKENASALANSKVDDKTVPKSHRIDAVFSLFRISFFHGCNIKGMSTAIEKATELIEGISGGDWSARNKLKAYEGVWSLAIRDFTRAAHLFVDVVPTFESYELADFGTIIRYTVLSCMIALPRCDLRKKLMLHGVMAQALHSQYQDLREYFVSLYDGRYSDFLVCLARIEVEMKRDPLLNPHYRHYVQEMRLRAYKQILQAYRSLSLDYMAQSFGVTSEFIEREVARFAAAGRLQCKIDSVAGTVITSAHLDDSVRSKEAPEASLDRNILYQTTVKRGDILLNRLKKLARVMDF